MDPEVDACERLGLLASAISGQRLDVAVADPGVLSWTDGRTVFVPVEADHQTQLQCVLVQASLLVRGEPQTRNSPEIDSKAHCSSALPEPRGTPCTDIPPGRSTSRSVSRSRSPYGGADRFSGFLIDLGPRRSADSGSSGLLWSDSARSRWAVS